MYVAKLFFLLLLFSSSFMPLSLALFQMPQFQEKKEFISLPQFLPKKKVRHLSVREFPFYMPQQKFLSIVSPLIFFLSLYSPPFVLHALLSFRSFHFYPQMTFYVPSVAFLFSYIITISHTYERKLVGWSLLIRLENGFGRIWMKLLWMGT